MGVDISPEMIELAQRQQGPEAQIEYIVQDCCKNEFTDKYAEMFDDVTATFLLNYATQEKMIQSFTDGAFRVLKPGGRLIGINTNPFLSTRSDFEASH